MKQVITLAALAPFVVSLGPLSGCKVAKVEAKAEGGREPVERVGQPYDQELARLLVRLELRTRAVIAKHYVAADAAHRDWLAENLLLPAAVADGIFHVVVPETTGDRAWVKMVVDEPRNPNNAGDATAIALFHEVRGGKPCAERLTPQGCYYAEPIKAAATCLKCHGQPRGEPDPFFPQYKKNGWKGGQIIGAVVARVAPRG